MAQNNYNIGSDAKLTLLADGIPVRAAIITEFTAKQETEKLKSKGLDGVVRNRHVEQGWSGTFKFDRSNPLLDDFIAAKEAAKYAGFPPPVMTITQSVVSAEDGSTAKYRFDGVSVTLDEAGTYAGDKKVEQTISWDASFRIKVA